MKKTNEEIAAELLHLVSTKRLVEELGARPGVDKVDIGYLEQINLKIFDDTETGPAIVLVVTD